MSRETAEALCGRPWGSQAKAHELPGVSTPCPRAFSEAQSAGVLKMSVNHSIERCPQ